MNCAVSKVLVLRLHLKYLSVTEINIKNIQKQDLKIIKNVKRCRDGMPKSRQTRAGIIHESKGQHIGKAPSLHLFHTTADAMLLDHISLVTSWHVGEEKGLGMRLKPCHIVSQVCS